ncbi:4-hydroxybenzoyl-CoA thioesterase family active site [Olavius algarvensis associated proteobacterium Delta 3]|nr:4-hydroxybenzoyl-CoA thioesterase family active site [Olavius algarvensis associated proteobacterium Delta 3]
MISHRTTCRVIYGDTDRMGRAYYGNYLRWFEMGRTEMFRAIGMPYRSIEDRGYYLPVSEVFCKFSSGADYDDILIIDTSLDNRVKAGMKFDYRVLAENGEQLIAQGYTKHAFVKEDGKVVRPPKFFREFVNNYQTSAGS